MKSKRINNTARGLVIVAAAICLMFCVLSVLAYVRPAYADDNIANPVTQAMTYLGSDSQLLVRDCGNPDGYYFMRSDVSGELDPHYQCWYYSAFDVDFFIYFENRDYAHGVVNGIRMAATKPNS